MERENEVEVRSSGRGGGGGGGLVTRGRSGEDALGRRGEEEEGGITVKEGRNTKSRLEGINKEGGGGRRTDRGAI